MPIDFRRTITLASCVLLVVATSIIVSCAGTETKSTSSNHPDTKKNQTCSECHEAKESMDHDKQWGNKA